MFEKTQPGYPGRGKEDVYTHPNYEYKFYVTRVRKDDKSLYGFLTGKKAGELLDNIYSHNIEDTFREGKNLPVWIDDAFVHLMNKF